MVHQSINQNNSNPLCKGDISNASAVAIRAEGLIRAVTDRSHDGDGEVAGVTKPCHYDREPKISLWRSAYDCHYVSQCTSNQGAYKHVYWYKPPKEHILWIEVLDVTGKKYMLIINSLEVMEKKGTK